MATSTSSLRLLASIALALAFAFGIVSPLAAQGATREGLDQKTLRATLLPDFEKLQTDGRITALRARIDGKDDDPAAVDSYLRAMPISPLEAYKIEMFKGRFETVVPRFLNDWHTRWIELNEKRSRDLYGNTYVDAKINRFRADTSQPGGIPGRATEVGANRNVASTDNPAPETYQGEIQLAVNPNNNNQMVAAGNTWDTINGTCGNGIQAVFFSGDGGDTWGYTCTPDQTGYAGMNCSGSVFGSDPAVYWNDNNEVFINYMLLCNTTATAYSMVVARSADGGATWNGQGVIRNSWSSGELEDKNFYVIDNHTTSPFYGRHYTCWDRNNNEKMAYSSNNGATWTEVDLPASTGSGSGSRFDLGCELEVEDDGTLHVVFNTLSCQATCNNEEMFHTVSTNGGVSWSTPTEVRDFSLVAFSNNSNPDAQDERGIGPFGAIGADNTGGPCDGFLYTTFGDYVAGEDENDTDVWVSRSTNGGTSWAAAVKVNDDGLANRSQFHSFLQVDQSTGDVVVAWHDARADAGNDAIEIYAARSTDCGLSFETNVAVSAPSGEFNNAGISSSNENTIDNPNNNPNQYGEYLGLDAQNGKAFIAWTDTRHFFPNFSSESQEENLGFAIVTWDDIPANTSPVVNVTAPADGSSSSLGASVSFAGSATDAEDGSLTASLGWSSSIDGSIGSGGSFSTSALSAGTHTITASVTDSGGAQGSDNISVTVVDPNNNGPQTALFDAGLGVPACAIAGSSCDSVALLDGRNSLGPEPNQPNTLDACTDGGSGSYHSDESNDRIVVSTLDSSDFIEGAIVQIDATVYAWSTGTSDSLDLYYTANANSPSWTFVATLAPPGGGVQTLSATYTLPAGGLQAVRAVFRYNGSVSSCGTGNYDDNDDLVFAVKPLGGNAAPVASISTPSDGATFTVGDSVAFSGSASDAEDGTLSANLTWASSLDGAIGSGASFSTTGLSIGAHTITASVTDSGGLSSSDVITVTINAVSNTAPSVTVTNPSNGASFTDGDSINFAGTATDTEDGTISANLSWSSSSDGAIGSGASFSTSALSVGSHTITASVTDSGGLQDSDAITVTVNAVSNDAPVVAIITPGNGSSSNDGDSVTFTGTATDTEDGNVAASLAWTSSIDGAIGSGASFATSALSVGSHTITASVTDSGGLPGSANISITVNAVGGGGPVLWMSFRSNTAVPGVGTVTDEDIVSYDESTGIWALEFDGSDVGIGSLEISGMAVLPGGDIIMSFTAAGTVGGIAVDDSDIVQFTPTSLGTTTAGTFSLYFDGSDVGLTANGEDIDGLALTGGNLAITTLGNASANGASPRDEDIVVFTGTLGANTSGSFSMLFDGSDVGLSTSSSEDVDAITFTNSGDLIFSTIGNFSVTGASGADEDAVNFSGTFGGSTSGSFSIRHDLTALGIISNEDIGSMHIIE